MHDNPLLQIEFRVPFDRIRAEHVEPAIRELLTRAEERKAALAQSSEATFEAVLGRLDTLTEALDDAFGIVRHLESVATSAELRTAYHAVEPAVSAFHAAIPLDEGLWRRIKEYAATAEAARLEGVRRRFLKKTLDDFRRHGAELGPAGKARLQEIEVELGRLTTRFSENVLDSTNAFELRITDPAQLSGLPPSAREMARRDAAAKGLDGWRFTLQAPSYTAVMTYLDDAALRERVWRAYHTRAARAPYDNLPLIERILQLRQEKARLLGYRHFADYVLEDRMAGSAERAYEFLLELKRKTETHFHRETEELRAFRRQLEGSGAPPLAPWDVAYYAEKQRKALYDFDEEALRPYFPLDRVVTGMFEIAARLFGVRIEQRRGVPSWDPETRYYEVYDESGELLGGFHADWRPRENKRGGAWMDALLTGGPRPDGFRPHLAVICGNLTPPVDGKPALLTHREVETIFHEFGHLLHHCLSRVEIRSLAGTNVAWDFVELPSQIMENWCWEREGLDLFARHWQTGEPLPQDLFEKMKRARTFRAASAQMRQLGFGLLDLGLHTQWEPGLDLLSWSRGLLEEFAPAPLPEDYAMIASFTHLFGNPVGYAAGYYSYKWAEVLDADAFSRFRERGVLNPEVGRAFRDSILARGDSEDPAALFRSFMGRDPDPAALLARLGL
ncbi:MAG: M3 family metallopeptidase [Bryobacterales bacterium]|nr:M3 family metallopeptidase [Bryobacteraceae bacterium]MDW8354390.1 M3 family metallopeptidase [Bryobacterales bacterium]